MRVQHQAGRRCVAVFGVAQHRKLDDRSMPANLVGPAGHRLGFDQVILTDRFHVLKPGRLIWPLFAEALPFRALGGKEQIILRDFVLFKLLGQRLVGPRGFTKNEDAGGILIEPVKNGKLVAAFQQPFVQAVGRILVRLVGIDAGGFIDDEQVGVFVKNQVHKSISACAGMLQIPR